jgi:hypothetical protein
VVGAVIISPLAIVVPLDEHASVNWGMLVITAFAGVPAGAILGLMVWLRRVRGNRTAA